MVAAPILTYSVRLLYFHERVSVLPLVQLVVKAYGVFTLSEHNLELSYY